MVKGPTLVTGAAGFAGSHLLDRLADQGPIIAWCRPGGRCPDHSRHLDWQAVDLLDPEAVRVAFETIAPGRVYHLAGAARRRHVVVDRRSPPAHERDGDTSLARGRSSLAASVPGAGRVVRPDLSAQRRSIDEDTPLAPANPYGVSKLAQDRLAGLAARQDRLDVVIARPFNHAGPRQSPAFAVASFARQIARIEAGLAPPELRVGNLDTRRDLTDVRDVVDAYVRLMEGAPAGQPYNICSGRAWRIRDLVDELLHLSTSSVSIEVDSARLRPQDISVIQGDATRLRTDLDWFPRIPVEQTLADTLEWWRGRRSRARVISGFVN